MKNDGGSRRLTRSIAHAACAAGVLVCVLLPVRKYAWMQAMQPGSDLPPEDSSARTLFVALVLLGVVAVQALLLAGARRRSERGLPLALLLAAVAAGASRLLR